MKKEHKERDVGRVKEIVTILSKEIPDAKIALRFSNPLELLIATILSAQCTDVRVNQVTESLFRKYTSAKDYAQADLEELEADIRPTGFFRNKSKAIRKCCQVLSDRFGGEVPRALEELTQLPGVGRKTANVILGNAFGIPGIVVDTHVRRVSQRIGLTKNSDPVKIEFDLMEIVPQKEWTHFSNLFIWHGRRTCVARRPLCERCTIRNLCTYGSDLLKKSKVQSSNVKLFALKGGAVRLKPLGPERVEGLAGHVPAKGMPKPK